MLEYFLIKNGFSYEDIQHLSDREVFEFLIIITEMNDYEKEKAAQSTQGIR